MGNWLPDVFTTGYVKIQGGSGSGGVDAPQERIVNFPGGVVTDDPVHNRTNVLLAGGIPSGDAGGSVVGTYPDNLIVQQLDGDPFNGDLPIQANQMIWQPDLMTYSFMNTILIQVASTDAGSVVAFYRSTASGQKLRYDAIITASNGASGDTATWNSTAFFRHSGSTSELIGVNTSPSIATSGAVGWVGPTWDVDSMLCRLTLSAGTSAGSIKWSVALQFSCLTG